MVNLLEMIKNTQPSEIISHIKKRIQEFQLPLESQDIRTKHYKEDEKNYYNETYIKYREYYNNSNRDIKDLYTLTFYSFCNLMRFNSKNEFNMPFGNRCFRKENEIEIYNCYDRINSKNIELKCGDSFEILKAITKNENQFLYFDPPYLNSTAIYNENRAFGGWDIKCDERLFAEMDRLSKLGIKWAYSNVLEIKGRNNNHIEEWANKNGYTIIEFEDKEYASLGKGNANAKEVLIINYEQKVKRFNIFDFMEK